MPSECYLLSNSFPSCYAINIFRFTSPQYLLVCMHPKFLKDKYLLLFVNLGMVRKIFSERELNKNGP